MNGLDTATTTVPIGPLQEGLWVFWTLHPDSAAYTVIDLVTVDGPVDADAVQRASDALVARHDALRTIFAETEAGVVQVVAAAAGPNRVDVVDLRSVDPDERASRLAEVWSRVVNEPFDLAVGPLVRITAVRESATRSTVALVVHHIVCDGTSMARLTAEFTELLRAATAGTPADLPPAPPGYPELVREQLADLSGPGLDEETEFWRRRLTGARGSVLPGDVRAEGTAPDALTTCTLSSVLEPDLVAVVRDRARSARATPFAVLTTTMQIMLSAATDEPAVTFGTVTEGRPRRFAGTIGMLANTLVLTADIDLGASFEEHLAKSHLDLLDALDHQGLPYSRAIGTLPGSTRGIGEDLIRTMFTGVSGGRTGPRPSVRYDHDLSYRVEGPFDLLVLCDLDGPTVTLDWEFALRAYSPATADGYRSAYLAVLAVLVGAPQVPLESLRLRALLARHVPTVIDAGDDAGRPATDPAVTPSAVAAPAATGDSSWSAAEHAVAAIWSEYLQVPVPSPEADFFELGGHSMVAVQVVAAVRRAVAPATMRMLFDHPSLREFCAQLDIAS